MDDRRNKSNNNAERKKYLKSTKDTIACRCPNKTNIKQSAEWPPGVSWFYREVLTSSLETLVFVNNTHKATK